MYSGAASCREFANPVHAVVGISTENKRAVLLERKCFSDQLERSSCIWSKDDGITPWRLEE